MSKGWSEEELEDSIKAYLDMQSRLASGEKFVKKGYYRSLSARHDRSEKAFEYRMQNISYVLSLMGRDWIPGLTPATNVGAKVGLRIERILAKIEERPVSYRLIFETEVNSLRNQINIKEPKGIYKPLKKEVNAVGYDRDPTVKAWVLENSNGICESCGNNAPFITKAGFPYLEVHHVQRLCDGGSDTIDNTVALCPNCHKEIHYGQKGDLIKKMLYNSLDRLKKRVN